MYQTKLYTYPKGNTNYSEISVQTLENEFQQLSESTYNELAEILEIFSFIDSLELQQELQTYGHYITARNDIFLTIKEVPNHENQSKP